MTNYIAICPKCETFTYIQHYIPDFCCLHSKEFLNFIKNEQVNTAIMEPTYEKILCKVIDQEEIRPTNE